MRYLVLVLMLMMTSAAAADDLSEQYQTAVQPFLAKYCNACHSQPEAKGRIDFQALDAPESVEGAFETYRAAIEMLEAGKMPPADEVQPTAAEKNQIKSWFENRFVHIEPRPVRIVPRRLSAHEYRNTLRSLLGFDLEVSVTEAEETISEKSMAMKLLPTDPPGASGYRNDTHRNPISNIAWQRYNELADLAIDDLFSDRRKPHLEAMAGPIGSDGFNLQNATRLTEHWLGRVYRRPMPREELTKVLERITSATDPVTACKFELKTSLVSSRFLYRGITAGPRTAGEPDVDDFELAERLSYFLWADMPDDALLRAAEQGRLADEGALEQQINRMLEVRQAENLATDLVGQWLLLDEINAVSDDVPVVVAYKTQVMDFVRYLIMEDRPLVELIDSKIEFVNDVTARFYGEDGKQYKRPYKPAGIEVQVFPNQRIQLVTARDRGGVLTMPGILAMNRGAIIRGTWMIERILGQHLPDPPPNVGQVKANQPGENLTFRERFALHRAQASCAVCHDRIDPLGFVLESYDQNGAAITNNKPDTAGQLPSGETFNDVVELKSILNGAQRRVVMKNIISQFLAYSLCRKLEYYDQPTIDQIAERLENSPGHGTYRQLIREITHSLPFRQALFNADSPQKRIAP